MVALTFSSPPLAGAEGADPALYVRHETDGVGRLELLVKGARCANCLAKIENGVKSLSGVREARLNLSTGKLAVSWFEESLPPAAILRRVHELGYEACAYDAQDQLAAEHDEGRSLLTSLAVAGFGSVFVVGLTDAIWYGGEMDEATRILFFWIAGLVAIPTALYAGIPFFRSAWRSLSKGRANMDLPISLAILLSLALSVYLTLIHDRHAYFDAAVMLPFLLLIGRYLDSVVRQKANSAARDLVAMQAVSVRRLDSLGNVESRAARDLKVGDRILVSVGERTPIDGMVEDCDTSADLSLVTGETRPVEVRKGETLLAGSIVTGNPVVLRVSARLENSLVAEVARLVEAGQQNRSRYVKLADRAASLYVPTVHGLALAVFLVWLFPLGAGFAVSLKYAISLLIVTCPCALGLAVPAVQVVATGRLFKRGLLVKSGDALERLADADVAVFDKTGTLTLGRPQLLAPQSFDASALEGAARLARASRHPLARALAGAAGPGSAAQGAREEGGAGLSAVENGVPVRLGSARFVGASDNASDASELWYRAGDNPPIRFTFADPIRNDAPEMVRALTSKGLEAQMLSGDREGVTSDIAQQLGITTWRSQTGPIEKASILEDLRLRGRLVLMIGDGLNDAAALAQAHVSISPARAVDAAQAAADMVLRTEQLAPIAESVDIARQARHRVLENFAFAALYNAVAVPLAALGMVTPLIAAVCMAASSLVVTLNALRLAIPGRG